MRDRNWEPAAAPGDDVGVDGPPAPEGLLQHAEFLRALATSLLHDAHDAEDVAQESMIAAIQSAPPSPGWMRAWLATVARNPSIARYRSLRRRAHRERIAARREAEGTEVPDAVARLEAQQCVVAAVLSLAPDDRAIVLDRFFHDMPGPTISHFLVAARRRGLLDDPLQEKPIL